MKKQLALTALCGALLSACSILPESRPVDVYRLPTSLEVPNTLPARSEGIGSVRVLLPATNNTLASRRIVVIPDDHLTSNYAGAAWEDSAPAMMRERLADALRAGGRFDTVSSDEHSLRAEFEVDSNLRALQSEYRNGTPEAVVRLDAHLVHSGSRRVLASRSFEARRPANGTGLPAVVTAMGEASDEVTQALAAWAAETAETVELPRPRRNRP